jgi:hypothetical protein
MAEGTQTSCPGLPRRLISNSSIADVLARALAPHGAALGAILR